MEILSVRCVAAVSSLIAQSSAQAQGIQTAARENWVRWLLPTVVQTVVSLASIMAGVWIALWSFGATSKRDRERWLLDQKKAEWRELLASLYRIGEQYLPPHRKGELTDTIIDRVHAAHRALDGITMQYVFISDPLSGVRAQIGELTKQLGEGADLLRQAQFSRRGETAVEREYNTLRDALYCFTQTVAMKAQLDLGMYAESGGWIIPVPPK